MYQNSLSRHNSRVVNYKNIFGVMIFQDDDYGDGDVDDDDDHHHHHHFHDDDDDDHHHDDHNDELMP